MYISDYELSSYAKDYLKDSINKHKSEIEKGMFSGLYETHMTIPKYVLTYLLIKSGINPLQDMNIIPSSFCGYVDKLELEIPANVKYLRRGAFSDIDDCTITFKGIPQKIEFKAFDGILNLEINFPGTAKQLRDILPIILLDDKLDELEIVAYDMFKGNKHVILNCLDQTVDLRY